MALDLTPLTPLGIVLAICAGSAINLGIVIQKKAVNEIPPDKRDQKFFRSLVVRRTWLLGLLVQIGIGTTCTVIANFIIGPALLPGLLAVGLIPMAIGAAKIVGEKLKSVEIFAICLVVVAAFLLVFSQISIPTLNNKIFIQFDFYGREWIFTAACFALILLCEFGQRRIKRSRSISLALQAGVFLALANYWLSPFEVHVADLAQGTLALPWELIVGIAGGLVLLFANIFNIAATQKAFKSGNASLVIPIQQVPINIAPIAIYFYVFDLAAQTSFTLAFLLTAIGLIVLSSYLLAKRQSQLENIKIEDSEKDGNASQVREEIAGQELVTEGEPEQVEVDLTSPASVEDDEN
jgi:hypothetical protein